MSVMVGAVHVVMLLATAPLALAQPVTVKVGNGSITLDVAAGSAFRIGVAHIGTSDTALDTPMVVKPSAPPPPFTRVTGKNGFSGIKTAYGSLLVNEDGVVQLLDADLNIITTSTPLLAARITSHASSLARASENCSIAPPQRSDCGMPIGRNQQSCEAAKCCWAPVNPNPGNAPWCFHPSGTPPPPPPPPPSPPSPPGPPPPPGKCVGRAFPGVDVNDGQHITGEPTGLLPSQDACCAACEGNPACQSWVYATPGHASQGLNCWLLTGVSSTHAVGDGSRVFGVTRGPIPPLPPPPPPQLVVTFSASTGATYRGAGASKASSASLSMTSSQPHVANTEFFTPHYYSSDGYSALAVSSLPNSDSNIAAYPAQWTASASNSMVKSSSSSSSSSSSLTNGSGVEWTVLGSRADFYLMPAKTNAGGLSALWDLTGRPAVPPRYAFGFLACRWGWKDRQYIHDTLTQFRTGLFPIDAWISDFGWFSSIPDYTLPPQGLPSYTDFGYNNITFPAPKDQLNEYHNQLHMRFGGIRKPRLGRTSSLEMAHARGWTITGNGGGNGGTRNLNYSIPELRTWYANQSANYLSDGVDFWWNDEGETFYFAFHWWNMAQIEGLANFDATKRFWSIDRSYTIGMSRLGAVIWTGDISVAWDALAQQPGTMLNWVLAGVGYVTCDTGGFSGSDASPLLLTRWYQLSTFLHVMRVHSYIDDTPHFPFLYPTDAANAMRDAMNLRYRLLPYHYSLAHAMHGAGGLPIMRPLFWEYPNDSKAATITTQWFDGEHLMPAPVISQDNTSSVYLPGPTTWFEFNSSTTHLGPLTLSLTDVPLDRMPLYVRAGAVITLGPVIQHTGELPGGPLEVQVYAGDDGSFTLVEDDGETLAYASGTSVAATRSTKFVWADASKVMSWTVSGTYSGADVYTDVNVVLFTSQGSTMKQGKLGTAGSVHF